MDFKDKYDNAGDMTIADLKKAGEIITDDMSIGALMGICEILYYGEELD